MSDPTKYFYVCDRCGNLVTIEAAPIPEGETWECDDCGSTAQWEFDNVTDALAHSRHIARIHNSRLFQSGS